MKSINRENFLLILDYIMLTHDLRPDPCWDTTIYLGNRWEEFASVLEGRVVFKDDVNRKDKSFKVGAYTFKEHPINTIKGMGPITDMFPDNN